MAIPTQRCGPQTRWKMRRARRLSLRHGPGRVGVVQTERPVVFTKNRRASLVATPPPEFEVLMSIHEQAIGHVRQESLDAFVQADVTSKQTWFHPSKAGTGGPSFTAWQAELEVRRACDMFRRTPIARP